MRRREFLQVTGAAAAFGGLSSGAAGSAATVLYDDHATDLSSTLVDPKIARNALWVRRTELPKINGFELKPQGACRADVCIPIKKDMVRGDYFDLTGFAKLVGQVVVVDSGARVWSFGEIPSFRGNFLESRIAPDFAVPDRKGRLVHLSAFRGKKVLVVTWASW
jgi:hypothetical protein